MLEAFGTRGLRLGLGAASLGIGAVAATRAIGLSEPLAAWSSGLGAVPPGDPLGIGLGIALLALGGLLLANRAVPYAAGALAALLSGSLLVVHPGVLGATQDLGLLGAALGLVGLPAALAARLPPRFAARPQADDPPGPNLDAIGLRRLAVRLGLALVFLLSGLEKVANTAWYADLLAASGGVTGWPLVGSSTPTGLLLWLGTGEVLLSGLLVWGPPARLASAIAAVLLGLDLLALHAPGLLTAKALGLLGAAVAGYCWASGATALANAQIGWLRGAARTDSGPEAPERR